MHEELKILLNTIDEQNLAISKQNNIDIPGVLENQAKIIQVH